MTFEEGALLEPLSVGNFPLFFLFSLSIHQTQEFMHAVVAGWWLAHMFLSQGLAQ